MVQASLFILAVLYGAAGICYSVGTIKKILNENEIKIIHCVRLMYAFTYGFLPLLIFWKESNGERNLSWYDYSADGLFHLYFMFLFSVLAYLVMLLFYNAVYMEKGSPKGTFHEIQEHDLRCRKDSHVLLTGTVALFFGIVSLLLWTRAYGSVYQFILNANAIRSGRGNVSNPFAFMKHLAKMVEIATYALLAALIVNRPKGMKRILYLALLILSIWATVLFLLASDGRTVIAMSAVAIIAILLRHRKLEQIGKYLVAAAIVTLLALILTISADTFTRYFRTGEWVLRDTGFFDSLVKEFQFIYSAQAYVIDTVMSGTLQLKFIDDLIIAVTRFIPDRFLPFSLPDSVWSYNTMNIYGTSASGTSPTDLLTTGIYYFGLIGVFVWPAAFAAFIGFIQNMLERNKSYYTDPYYGLLIGVCIHTVSHNQLSSFVLMLFPGLLYFLVSRSLAFLQLGKNK